VTSFQEMALAHNLAPVRGDGEPPRPAPNGGAGLSQAEHDASRPAGMEPVDATHRTMNVRDRDTGDVVDGASWEAWHGKPARGAGFPSLG